jgi:SAM-dependent methyltransferase
MRNPWLDVPLADYEGHMSAPQVAQLGALADLFGEALVYAKPESVAILGIAGGNGLDRVDPARVRRVVGVDISQDYLDRVRERYSELPLDLHLTDLSCVRLGVGPVDLVHAALIFEHTGCGMALANALATVKPGGHLAAVLQLPSQSTAGVSQTGFDSMQGLAKDFALIDAEAFSRDIETRGLRMVHQIRRPVAGGKALWMGMFVNSEGA